MLTEAEIFDLLEESLEEIQEGHVQKSAFSPDLPLLGANGALDSLDTMLFLDMADRKLAEKTGLSIVLDAEKALEVVPSPFADMRSLNAYIRDILAQS